MVWSGYWSAGDNAGAVVGVDEAGQVGAVGGGALRKKSMSGKVVLERIELSSKFWGKLEFGLSDPL